MQQELRTRGIIVFDSSIIMTSDETDEAWWAQVAEFGWKRIDHVALQTEERHGKWSVAISSFPFLSSAGVLTSLSM